jgi:hypothetical protein
MPNCMGWLCIAAALPACAAILLTIIRL